MNNQYLRNRESWNVCKKDAAAKKFSVIANGRKAYKCKN